MKNNGVIIKYIALIFLTISFFIPRIAFSVEVVKESFYDSGCLDDMSSKDKDLSIKYIIKSKPFNIYKKKLGIDSRKVKFTFLLEMISREKIQNMCLIVIPVYIDEEDHLNLWKLFSIGENNKIYIQDFNGIFLEFKN